ncbi:hypothetical protein [Methylobacterium haplocladii]|uniref:Uncharacterized protein n=1 Tax=Methylobacterium haplocladii TaxID=1176176 RepID=A0A512IRI2_9HYPH|nr:hypothetical protein [Methylobacterium haplocladii]GEP00286.1 hypothetical protein MHA02_26730 [Methylobacterium haplocladii]GJD83388.1 hypothetical protein HPGCJGGD_1254 [Methylobacterium haplocladii]GLS59776.1 hypothetical protein GCM10007887_24490 [Methylobacterium haplocladii]
MAQVETGKESRQGEKGKPVLYVLVAAVILAIVAGAGVLTWQGSVSPNDHGSQSTEAARSTATNPTQAPAEKKQN